MSASVKSLIIGSVMLIGGLILFFFTRGIELPVFTPYKVGLVLAVLGVIELVITGAVMIFPSKKKIDG